MTPEQKTLVKNSWQKLAPLADKAASLFYDRLFEIDATVRALFKTTNLTEQRRKLIQALALVVNGLDNLECACSDHRRPGPASCAIWRHERPIRHGWCCIAVDA